MSTHFTGDVSFKESAEPVYNVNDFGMDGITRKFRGAVHLLDTFLRSLNRGQTYNGCYLTSWTHDDHRSFPEVTLTYKGVIESRDPLGTSETGISTVTTTTATPIEASRDVQYYSPQTTWRYVTNSRQISAKVGDVYGNIVVINSVIRDKYGNIYTGVAPAGLVTALLLPEKKVLVNLRSEPVPGTPFFENEETIAKMYLPKT